MPGSSFRYFQTLITDRDFWCSDYLVPSFALTILFFEPQNIVYLRRRNHAKQVVDAVTNSEREIQKSSSGITDKFPPQTTFTTLFRTHLNVAHRLERGKQEHEAKSQQKHVHEFPIHCAVVSITFTFLKISVPTDFEL